MGTIEPNAKGRGKISRRAVLRGAGAAGVAVAAAGVVGRPLVNYAIAGNDPKLRLAWTEVAACHSPLGFGLAKGFYSKHGLDVELFFQGASGQTLIQALATGKSDAGAGLLYDWLKPLEQGFDVKLFVGSHGGCQRLLTPKSTGIVTLEDLKGKTIGTWDAGSPSRVAFSVALAKAGIDPDQDVTWKVFPFDLVGDAVARGEADAAAHMDPWAYGFQKNFDFHQIADTHTGSFDGTVCCVLGVNTPFYEANKDAIRRLAEANIEIHQYTSDHPEEVATWYLENLKPGNLTLEDLTDNLSQLPYHNHPIGPELVEQVRLGFEDLKLTHVIEEGTDAAALANKVTLDILST